MPALSQVFGSGETTNNATTNKRVIKSRELTVRNLSTDISNEIKAQIEGQEILSIPRIGFRDEAYIGAGGEESMMTIDTEIDTQIKKGTKDTLMNSIAFRMWNRENKKKNTGENGSRLINDDISLRIGQSPVINPPWQFNELDDVRSNITYPHMGRVYLTYIYTNFPIITFKPGREKMNANMLTFFTKGIGTDHKVLNDYIRNGGHSGLINGIRMGLTSIKNITLGAIEGVLNVLGFNFADASKFITFKPAMKLYRQMANGLLNEFASHLGLLDLTNEKYNDSGMNFDLTLRNDITEGKDKELLDSYKENIKKEQQEGGTLYNGDKTTVDQIFADGTLPTLENGLENLDSDNNDGGFGSEMDKNGNSISDTKYEINGWESALKFASDAMSSISAPYRGTIPRLDVIDMIPGSTFKTEGINSIGKFFGDIENKSYLPYLCQSNVSISESFSNTTKEHPIVSEINSMSDSASDEKGIGGVRSVIDAAKSAIEGAKSGNIADNLKNVATEFVFRAGAKLTKEMVSNVSEIGMLINGDGKMAIPEIWSSSSFSRSYSVEFKFWSPVGDIVSIFENVYIPYLLLFVLASPLQSGYNAYVAPFIIKVFSRGLFSIDMGMIENLNITRGDGSNDRTIQQFPRSIKVSVSVKDLAPVMMLSLNSGAFWKYRRANSSLGEYIATMCNLSLADRANIAEKWDTYWAMLTAKIRGKFSLSNIGYSLGSSFVFRPFVSWNRNKVTIDTTKTKNIYL